MKYLLTIFVIIAASCNNKTQQSGLPPWRGVPADSVDISIFADTWHSFAITVTDSTMFVPVELRRTISGDTMIIRDSLKAIKTLLEQLNDCSKKRMKETEATYHFRQVADTTPKKDKWRDVAGASTGSTILWVDSAGNIIEPQDTIKVLMLVCDTADQQYFTSEAIFDATGGLLTAEITDSFTLKYWGVFWRFGYEVWTQKWVETYWESVSSGNLSFQLIEVPAHFERDKFIIRLDANKKPLPKSLVVWMTKEIK